MPIEIWIPDAMWQPNNALEDPRARLITKLVINGTDLHLEAWEVHVDSDGVQEATAGEDKGDFASLYEAVHADGHMSTTEILGREYILVATPYC